MYQFNEMIAKLNEMAKERKRVVAVAAAGDDEVLKAVKDMNTHGFGRAILIGDGQKIETYAKEVGVDLNENTIIDEKDDAKAAALAVKKVRDDEADILMKGLLQTKTYLRAILNKEEGLRTGKLLCSITAVEAEAIDRMLLVSDCAMVVNPSATEKVDIIHHTVELAHALGEPLPKVSLLAAVETVNDNMPDTLESAAIAKSYQQGKISGCVVDGPLSMDLSISERSARHKGIDSPVAGKADVLIMPNIQAGNIFWKTMTYLAGAKSGAIIAGTSKPAVIYSRSDSAESKINAIAMAMMLAEHKAG